MKEKLEKICNVEEQDGVFIPIDQSWKDVAISVSGGADSALLAYLICSFLKSTNIHIISNIRMWKTRPWQRYNSIDVFNWLMERFPNHKFSRHENFIAPEIEYGTIGRSIKTISGQLKSGDQISTISFVEYFCYNNNINIWFAGVTKNPEDENIIYKLPERNTKYLGNDRDIEKIIYMNNNVWLCHPFIFSSKDWILKQYIDLNILDLFKITRSCEGDLNSQPNVFKGLDYKTYTPSMFVPECGSCFWCQERNWAKSKNKL